MERYAIMVQKRQGVDLEAVKEMLCAEERAVRECCRIFRASGMQKVILVDEHFNIVFKDSRRCKCGNVQEEMYPTPDGDIRFRLVCMDCGVVIDPEGWRGGEEVEHKVEEMIR